MLPTSSTAGGFRCFLFFLSALVLAFEGVDDLEEEEELRLPPDPRERATEAGVEDAILDSSLDSAML